MTKFRILSDLHCEGYPFTYEHQGEDVVLLAGDIHTRNRLHTLLDQIPSDITTYFVPGNHEYYHGVFELCNAYFKQLESQYNFVFLNNSSAMIGDIPIYGGTMFTDFELHGVGNKWFATHRAKDGINDFAAIETFGEFFEPTPWSVSDHIKQHGLFVDGLKVFLKHTEGAEKRIVMSHFMCTEQCSAPQFKGSTMNPYFANNMERYMGWDGLWVCGHGHSPADFGVDGTRVIMNPRGYMHRYVENPRFNPNLIVEL